MSDNEHNTPLDDGDTLLTPAGREAFERAAARREAKARLRRAMQENPGGRVLPPAPPRLRCMTLPNGKFLLVLDGWPGDTDHAQYALNEACHDAGALVFRDRVDVHSWADLDAATDQACALTDDATDNSALMADLRRYVAAQASEAEAWREHGRQAVEDCDALRVRADRAEDELERLRAAGRRVVAAVAEGAAYMPGMAAARTAVDALNVELERAS